MTLLGKRFDPPPSTEFPSDTRATAIRPLLDFLLLNEKHRATVPPPYPGVIALHAVLATAEHEYFDEAVLPVLTRVLSPNHPLQSRVLALRLFQQPGFEWCSSRSEAFTDADRAEFLEAVGDPFQFTQDPPSQDGKSTTATPYEPMKTATLLIELASSDLWRDHLRSSNFTSCEEIISTPEGRDLASRCMNERNIARMGPFDPISRLSSAISRLEELGCRNTAEAVAAWVERGRLQDKGNENHNTQTVDDVQPGL